MNIDCRDKGFRLVLEGQLKDAGYKWLDLDPECNVKVGPLSFPVYGMMASYGANIIDCWVVSDFRSCKAYSKQTHKLPSDAVAHFVGDMVLDGLLLVVRVMKKSDGEDDEQEPEIEEDE